MRCRCLLVVSCAAISSVACSRTVLPTPDGSTTTEGGVFDSNGRDVPLGSDATPGFDGEHPTDVPLPSDVPVFTDVPIGSDVPPGSIEGAYRLVGYETPDGDGGITRLSDMNQSIETGGVTYDIRVDGMLFLTSTRLTETIGVLANDHFFATDQAMDYASSLSAYGAALPGTLSGTTFTNLGGTVMFERNADGTIAQIDSSAGTRLVWSRTAVVPGAASISVDVQAQQWHPSMSVRLVTPRAALAWDLPGTAGGQLTTNDVPISFGSFGTASFHVSLNSPPAMAMGSLGGTSVALAYPIVYDDTNRSGRYEPGTDMLRGVGPIAIAWRRGPASIQFQRSLVRALQEGFQYALVHPDYSTARLAVTPFDPNGSTPPDLAVDIAETGVNLPDIVR